MIKLTLSKSGLGQGFVALDFNSAFRNPQCEGPASCILILKLETCYLKLSMHLRYPLLASGVKIIKQKSATRI